MSSYTTLKVKRAVLEELLAAKEKGVYGTWTAFFMHALPRCPACNSIIVVKHNKLKCVNCLREYRLC